MKKLFSIRDFVEELRYQYRAKRSITEVETLQEHDIASIIEACGEEIRKEIYKQEGIFKKTK